MSGQGGPLRIEVAYATPQRQWLLPLALPAGTTLGEALARSGLAQQIPELDLAALRTGIHGRPCGADTVLRDGDRVELYRPLQADAKAARRERARAKRQGKRR